MNRLKERTELPWVPCTLTFIPTLKLCKKDVSDIIKWCHCCLLLHFGQEKPLCMCSQVKQAHLHICWHPQPISHTLPCMNHYVSFIPQSQCLWHSPPGILVHPHTTACNLFKKVIINGSKLYIKIGKIYAYNKIGSYNMDGMKINKQMNTTGN